MTFARRKRRTGIFRTPQFFARFQRNTEASLFRNNRVELLPDGSSFFRSLLEAIRSATTCILVEFYIIRDDHAGQAFAEALLDAADRGVPVHVIYDYIGCFDTSGTYFRNLERRGIKCLPFNPPPFRRGLGWFDKRNHRKLTVIDGRVAFLGGLNIGNEYCGFGDEKSIWRDVGMEVRGPAVAELVRVFWASWQEGDAELPPVACAAVPQTLPEGDADVLIVTGGPHHTRSYIRSAYRMAIASASDSITIITPYFVPGPLVVRSLLRAAARGVSVRIILPSISDVPLIRWASRGFFHPLLKAGIEIYEREGTVLHAKAMLIDGCWAVFGSANLDLRSFHRNYELNVIVDSADFGDQVERMVERDLEKSRQITLQEHESRGAFGRLLEMLCSPIRRFL